MENILNILGAGLSFAAACMGLIDKYGWRKGWFITSAVLAVVVILSIILKRFAKKDKKEKEPPFIGKSIGDGATTDGKMEFEDIEQKGSSTQLIGKGAEAGEGISFKKIRQE
ncbi:MAG: hypothetical protein D3915_12800 [Candidatus Electrothrix sp. AU1_5]|nr:hypothetical protein [Candidatus Electrothrix gigas]